MAKTVIGLLNDRQEAEKAVEELQKSGFSKKDIGIITSEGVVARDVGKGAAFGTVAGALLAGAALLVPGLGPVLAAGPAATLLAGASAGALAGGMIGALTAKGVPEEEAHFYAEGIQRGGTLVTVHAEKEEQEAQAMQVLQRHGAADIKERADEWKKEGWNGRFEPKKLVEKAKALARKPKGEKAQQAEPVKRPAGEKEDEHAEEPELAAVEIYSLVIELPAGAEAENRAR